MRIVKAENIISIRHSNTTEIMEERVLRPVGNIQPLQQQQVFTFDDDVSSSWQRKISATVAPLPSKTPEKENQPLKPLCLTPVLPGTRTITHNITRMLPDTQCGNPFQTSTPERTTLPNFGQSAFQPFTSRSFLDINKSSTSYIDYTAAEQSKQDHTTSGYETDILDRDSISPPFNKRDSPVLTKSVSSSPLSSNKSPVHQSTSPESGCGSGTSPEAENQPPRKKARTMYRPDQIKVLERQFQENPYPDFDRFETLSKDLEIPENKLKIWFQNKRARWRRRTSNNMNSPFNHCMPLSPVLPQVTPYGMMQTQFMTSSPLQAMPGFYHSQGLLSPYTNQLVNKHLASNQISNSQLANNQSYNRLHETSSVFTSQPSASLPLTPTSLGMSTNYSTMNSPSNTVATNYRQLQYPYPTSFGLVPQSSHS